MADETDNPATQTKMYDHDGGLYYVPHTIVTFNDLDAYREGVERARQTALILANFKELADNIVYGGETADIPAALDTLTREFVERLGEAVEDDDVQKAVAETVTEKGWKVPAFWARRKEAVAAPVPAEPPAPALPVPPQGGMVIYKSGTQYRWAAAYSNSFRDNDHPAEIITADSHRKFVAEVESGQAPYPELWLWHQKTLKVGQADWVAVDEISDTVVFALAGGYFDEGMEDVADVLSKQGTLGVSHGMPLASLEYDPQDKSVIVQHRTIEISPLTVNAAANKLAHFTSATVTKEITMIDPQDKEKLAKIGVSADLIDAIEARNAAQADKAIADAVQHKDETPAEPALEPAAEAAVEPAPAELTERERLLVSAVVAEVKAQLIDPLAAQVKELTETKAAPAATGDESLDSLPLSVRGLVGSIIGKEAAAVTAGDSLLTQKPKETPIPEPDAGNGLPPFLRGIINSTPAAG